MVTVPNAASPLRGDESSFFADQSFFTKFSAILALIIIFGFAQFAARGIVDISAAPVWVHLHGIMMLLWLGLFVGQNVLIQRGAIKNHRRLGWFSLVAAFVVVTLTCFTGYMAVALGRQPPFFSGPYFLALVYVEALVFLAMIIWAITKRRHTQWHRRLMFGATIIILEPAFGRLLPLPLMGDWGEWVIMLVQLGFVAVIARHDRRALGQVHPATAAIAVIVVAVHVAVASLALWAPLASFAESVAATV
ncbi:adenylate cyclase [Parasphingorhabdus sp.]|uniref:adenylate cyclase n=1 Tax=Parasphingorhabdus sp. TaxID=2709688 RepID=UPI0032ED57A4